MALIGALEWIEPDRSSVGPRPEAGWSRVHWGHYWLGLPVPAGSPGRGPETRVAPGQNSQLCWVLLRVYHGKGWRGL